jgi:hypothetical protein
MLHLQARRVGTLFSLVLVAIAVTVAWLFAG